MSIEYATPDSLRTSAANPNSGAGYELAHHGEGRWNGVAVASRIGIADVVTNFGAPRVPTGASGEAVGDAAAPAVDRDPPRR